MTIKTMFNPAGLSLTEIKDFLGSSTTLNFKSESVKERNEFIEKIIRKHNYFKCLKKEKGLIKEYIQKITGLSRSQLTKLIGEYKKRGTLKPKERKRNKFSKVYELKDIILLADVDNAHNRLSGPATKKIIEEECDIFKNEKYGKLKDLSVSHMYRLRKTRKYQEKVKKFEKTKPSKVSIGERRKPEPNGIPGYLCVDTVHQGDKDKEKGVYHINIVDMVTQYEFIGAVEAISERYMEEILKDLLKKFPFTVIEFHSDNGSEYINKVVAKLLNKLLIKLTKSRPRHSNDNPLIETKNGAVIRKHMGYIHIPKNKAKIVNKYYQDWYNNYLNYHRPCAFPEITTDKKGKEKRTYPYHKYMRPYEKLKSIKDVEKYLKSGISFEELDKKVYSISHTEYAIKMNQAKDKMLKQIFNKNINN